MNLGSFSAVICGDLSRVIVIEKHVKTGSENKPKSRTF